MRYALLAAALIAAPSSAHDTSDADAKAALAIAKAKARQPSVKAQTRAIPYADAQRLAKKEGRPILVAIGFDCQATAKALRPNVITCREETLDGSAARRVRLEIPAATPSGWIKLEWTRCPSPDEVKAEIVKHSPHTSLNEQRDDAINRLVLAMTALDADAGATPGFRQVCENGACRLVPIDQQRMPTAGGPVFAFPPAASGSAAGRRFFKPRFPRIAAVRDRLRERRGLPPPRARGQAYTATDQGVPPTDHFPSVPELIPASASANPQVVGGPRGHRLIKLYLARQGVPAADLEKFEAKYGDGSAWADLLLAFFRGSLELLLELLEKMLAK